MPTIKGTPGDIKTRFGGRLRELRERAGLGQGDLAQASGISRVFYGTVERGEKAATVETVEKLARGLALPEWELFRFGMRGGPSDAAEKLARKVASLSRGSSEAKVARFERIARAFFESDPEESAPTRRKRRRPSS